MGTIKIVKGAPTRIGDSDRHRLLLTEQPSPKWLAALHGAAQVSEKGQSLCIKDEGGSSLTFTSSVGNLRENMMLVTNLIRVANDNTDC